MAWIAVVFFVLFVLVVLAAIVLPILGRERLRRNATSQRPDLGIAGNEVSEEGESPQGTGENVASEEYEDWGEWEEDWISYKGEVYDYNEEILTFLCMGIDVDDTVKEDQKGYDSGQADALFLAVIDPLKEELYIIAIDRNTMTEFDAYDENGNFMFTQYGQIALAHGYGDGKEQSALNTLKAVDSVMYNIPIHGYCAVNMKSIPIINDLVGGVDVTVLEDLTFADKRFMKGAQLHLMGDMAYAYVHYRDITVDASARGRLNRQKQYLQGYVDQAKAAFRKDVTLPFTLFNAVLPYMTTDITVDEVVYLAGQVVNYEFTEENLILIPGVTDTSKEFDEFYPDEEQLRQMIIDIFYIPLDIEE